MQILNPSIQIIGRIPFPAKWLGNPDKKIGMTFCHPENFLASIETLEQAINIANIAIELNNKETSSL